MKIDLLGLNHATCGVHTNTAPLGLGLVAAHFKINVNHPLE